jgi:phospholipid/cholesterol/gamma-HCH transport system permease protein
MLSRIGRWLNGRLKETLYALGYAYTVFKAIPEFFRSRKIGSRVLVMQILFTGVEALGLSALIALAIGGAIDVVGLSLLPSFGTSSILPAILIAVITRELGPLMTAFIIIARSGTAIATELGNMVVDHEVEAYVSFGIDPIVHLVVPRLIGVTVALLALNVYFNIFGLLGSFLVVQVASPIRAAEYFYPLFKTLKPEDLAVGVLKSLAFGIIVALVSSYQGLKVSRATTEIPVAGIKAVGGSFALCIVTDAILSVLYYVR